MRAQVPQLEARLARAGHGDVARRPATDLAYWSEGSIAGRGALARWHGGTWWHIRCRDHVRGVTREDCVELCKNSALEAPVRAAAIEITFVFKLDLGRNLAM